MQHVGFLASGWSWVVLQFAWLGIWATLVLSVGLWVARDAARRGSENPRRWGILSGLTGVGLLVYYRHRRRALGPRQPLPDRLDRTLATLALASGVAFVVGTLASPPDPFSQALYSVGALVIAVPTAYLVVRHRTGWD